MPNAHDRLVRRTFGDVRHARGLLQSLLPQAVSVRVDWQSLRIVDGSFIDPQLAARQTDLLYSVSIHGRAAFLYVLLEHQSSSDRWMVVRMLEYVLRIWQRYRDNEPRATLLPVVVPLVLHHSAKGWSAPTCLAELVDADDAFRVILGELIPSFAFALTDLTKQEDRALHAWLTTDLGKLVALCLKHAPYDALLEKRLREWLRLYGQTIRAEGGVAGLEAVARYILEVNEISAGTMREVLQSALEPAAVEAIMTGAEQLRAEGRVEGRAEGRAEGRVEAVLKLLTLRFGALPDAATVRLSSASVDELDGIMSRLLTAETLDQVLGSD